MSVALESLSARAGVSVGDCRVLLVGVHELVGEEIPDDIAEDLWFTLNPTGERIVPGLLGYLGDPQYVHTSQLTVWG